MNNPSEYVQYYVVNSELNMSAGKIAAQVAHAATIMAVKYASEPDFQTWFQNHQTKIVLRGKQKDLEKLIDQGFDYIVDAGFTEIPPNSLTVVGLKPMKKEDAKQYVGKLQLFKG